MGMGHDGWSLGACEDGHEHTCIWYVRMNIWTWTWIWTYMHMMSTHMHGGHVAWVYRVEWIHDIDSWAWGAMSGMDIWMPR